jgi:CheY-like chemotaxis protein
MDGTEVLRQLKTNRTIAYIPVVMLTSSAEESDIARSYALGVNSYLVKPVEFGRFVEEVADAGQYWLVINRVPPGAPTENLEMS